MATTQPPTVTSTQPATMTTTQSATMTTTQPAIIVTKQPATIATTQPVTMVTTQPATMATTQHAAGDSGAKQHHNTLITRQHIILTTLKDTIATRRHNGNAQNKSTAAFQQAGEREVRNKRPERQQSVTQNSSSNQTHHTWLAELPDFSLAM